MTSRESCARSQLREKNITIRDNARSRWHCDSIRLIRMIYDRSYVGIDIVRLRVK